LEQRQQPTTQVINQGRNPHALLYGLYGFPRGSNIQCTSKEFIDFVVKTLMQPWAA